MPRGQQEVPEGCRLYFEGRQDIGGCYVDANALKCLTDLKCLTAVSLIRLPLSATDALVTLLLPDHLTEVDLSSTGQLITSIAETVGKLQSLRLLRIARTGITPSECEEIVKCSNLETLDLSGCWNINDEALILLKQLPRLQFIELQGCHAVTGKGLMLLTSFRSLLGINASGLEEKSIDIAVLTAWKESKRIRRLVLHSIMHFKDVHLLVIADFEHLEELDVSSCSEVSTSGLCALAKCRELTKLTIGGNKPLNDLIGPAFAEMKNLEALSVSADNISDETASILLTLPKLKQLSIEGYCALSSKCIASLLSSSKFERLSIANAKNARLDNVAFNIKSDVQNPRELDISFVECLYGRDLAFLSHLAGLRVLRMQWQEPPTQQQLTTIIGLKALEVLDLFHSESITDAMLLRLAESQTLKEVRVQWCRNITDEGVRAAQKVNPRFTVVR